MKPKNIIVINLKRSWDTLCVAQLVQDLSANFSGGHIDFAVSKELENEAQNLAQNSQIKAKFHIYDPASVQKFSFFKKLFYEIKFIYRIKKEKYALALLPSLSSKGVLVAKYAKIGLIFAQPSGNKKVDKFITHKLSTMSQNLAKLAKETLDAPWLEVFNYKIQNLVNFDNYWHRLSKIVIIRKILPHKEFYGTS